MAGAVRGCLRGHSVASVAGRRGTSSATRVATRREGSRSNSHRWTATGRAAPMPSTRTRQMYAVSTLVAGSPHCGGVCRSREVPHWAVAAAALPSEMVERSSGHAPPASVRCVPDQLDCGGNNLLIHVDVLNWTRSRSTMAPTEEASSSKGTTEEPDLELRL